MVSAEENASGGAKGLAFLHEAVDHRGSHPDHCSASLPANRSAAGHLVERLQVLDIDHHIMLAHNHWRRSKS